MRSSSVRHYGGPSLQATKTFNNRLISKAKEGMRWMTASILCRKCFVKSESQPPGGIGF